MALAYASTWADICNLALGRLGAKKITEVDPPDTGSVPALYCQRYLPDAIDEVLQYHDWIGMTKRAALARYESPPGTPVVPAFGFAYFFTLPTDRERILEVDAGGSPWRREQEYILTDATAVNLKYIFRPTSSDVAKIPRPLQRTIAACLAFLLAPPLTADEKTSNRIAGEKETAFSIALDNDGKSELEATLADEIGVSWYDEAR